MGSVDSSPPSPTIQKILILGDNFPATPIIHALATTNQFSIHIAHPHVPSIPAHETVTYHTVRITPAALTPLLRELEPDLVINTFTSGPAESKCRLIDAVVGAGVKRFVPCEFGHDSLNERVQRRLGSCRERAETIRYLRRLAGEGKISWCAVAVGTVLDRGILSGNLGLDLAWSNATFHGRGDEGFAACSGAWIGRVVLAMVRRWEVVENRYLYASGLVTSANEVVGCLAGRTGKEWSVDRGDVEQCVREAEQRIERGFPDAGMFLMERSLLYDEDLGAMRHFEEEDAKVALGLKGESLDGVVEGVVHEHEHHAGSKVGCGCD